MRLQLEENRIIWPGGLTQNPTGLMIPTHLNVLTIVEKPFVYERKVAKGEDCRPEMGEIPCPLYDTTGKRKRGM